MQAQKNVTKCEPVLEDDCHINSLQQSYCPERNQILVWLNFSLQTLPVGIAICESSPQGFKYVF